ncbi:methyltransferase domain-containing protein [Jonesia quinghaiensis]|uniref:methyltransferase domain-containing protein n=1 Tax=Jonesia quinghaiensis TaxID=262806 RepID=UPI000403E46D|nr:methyltransferase domain-containing protein [Jonesia quinghaiensis]
MANPSNVDLMSNTATNDLAVSIVAAGNAATHSAPGSDHSDQTQESESYTHGHHESVLRSHRARNIANSAAYLTSYLRPGQTMLDVGCGPGTLTIDLARALAPGQVTGVDAADIVLESARALATEQGVNNVTFAQANVYELPFDDGSFDIVHAHQVLQHLSDPVKAINEMRRVTAPGGIIAVRDADYGAMTWYPPSEGLTEWNILYHEVTSAYGYEADAGRRLLSWFRAAGIDAENIQPSAGVWCYATPESREWWGALWAERCVASNFAVQARDAGLADDVALEDLAEEWRTWAEQPDGWFMIPHGEIIVHV